MGLKIIYTGNRMIIQKEFNKSFLVILLISVFVLIYYGNVALTIMSVIACLISISIRGRSIINNELNIISVGYNIFGFFLEKERFGIPLGFSIDVEKFPSNDGEMGYGVFIKKDLFDKEICAVDSYEEGVEKAIQIAKYLNIEFNEKGN